MSDTTPFYYPALRRMEAPKNSICLSGLDPVLANLGQLIGLLEHNGNDAYCIDDGWFQNPIAKTAQGVKGNGDQLAMLLAQLLGEVGGHALGVPVKDPALLGTWYPINKPGTADATGLYAVTYPKDECQVFGIGAYHKWDVPTESPELQVDVWGMVPILKIGGGRLEPVLNVIGFPITLGIAVEGCDEKKPLIDTHGFAFNGVKFSGALDMADRKNPVQLAVVILKLKLPGEDQAEDRSLADLTAISGEKILNTASSLFISALADVSETASERAAWLLPMLGLATSVPATAPKLPLLRWDQLFALAFHNKNVAIPFIDWFTAICSDAELLKTWLTCIAGFMGASQPVRGVGTREDPLQVPIVDLSKKTDAIPAVGVLSFSTATFVDKAGKLHFYPGLDFQAVPIPLGDSDAALTMRADLELAEFVLSRDHNVKFTGPASLQFDAGFILAGISDGKPLAEIDGYRFGALEAGLALGLGPKVIPSFKLVDLETPQGKFDAINLLSPGALAQTAEKALVPMLESQLKKLLGIEADKKIPFAGNLAALLGVVPPDVPGDGAWPMDQLPVPFTIQQLPATMKDPVGALGNYYEKLLTSGEKVAGKSAFHYILLEMAGLLEDTTGAQKSVDIQIDGDGSRVSPWTARLSLGDITLPAGLSAFTEKPDAGVTRLVLGLELGPVVTIAGIEIVPSVTLNILSLDLPAPGSSKSFSGLWAPDITARLALPRGFTTPAVAGAAIGTANASMSARWSRLDGWHWSLFAGKPRLTIGEQIIDINQDLSFSDADSLRKLVTEEAAKFSPLLVGMLGVALLRTKTRAGLALCGILGLLPDLDQAENFPAWPDGRQWPGIPQLKLDELKDPRAVLRAKIADDLSSDEKARAILALLAWTINDTETGVPDVPGSRAFSRAFKVPLGASGFEGRVWYEEASHGLGLGLGQTDVFTYQSDLKATVETRLNAVEVDLASGKLIAGTNTPSLSFLTTLENPDPEKPLLQMPGPAADAAARLGKLILGFSLHIADKKLWFDPVVTLVDVTLPGQTKPETLTLADFLKPGFEGKLEQAFLALVNEGIQTAILQVADRSAFQTAYALLSSLGLAIPRTAASDPYGINPPGWRALLADPTKFFGQQLTALLADNAVRDRLFDFIQDTLNIHLPKIPVPVLDVLAALEFVGPAEHGYPLRPQKLLELASHPFQTLCDRFEALVSVDNPAPRRALISKLAGNSKSHDFGIFSFSSTAGTDINLAIKAENAFDIGGLLNIYGDIAFNLDDFTLSTRIRCFNPTLGLALVPSLGLTLAGAGPAAPDFCLQIFWCNGNRPAAAPLKIYPFQPDEFVKELADLAPAYVLSTIVTAVVEHQLLDKFPLVQQVFEGLGLAQDKDGRWTMPSLLGLLHDPKGWLLAEDVLGTTDGRFNLAVFGNLLKKLPQVKAANGLAVTPTDTGARVSGLPYKFNIDLSSTPDLATIRLAAGDLDIARGNGKLKNLSVAVSLDADYQPGIAGDVSLATAGSISPFFVEAGYDKQFKFTVGQDNPDGAAGLSLQILPFQGWGALAEDAARIMAPKLIEELMPRLLEALEKAGAKEFARGMGNAGSKLEVAKLIEAIAQVDPFTLEGIEKTALDWLMDRVSDANAKNAAAAVAGLLQIVLPDKIAAADGLITYKPSEQLPLTLKAGANTIDDTRLLGLWTELQLPELSLLKADIKETGIGIPLEGAPKPVFSFGVDLTIPVDLDIGPQLGFRFDAAGGFTLTFDPLGDSSDLTRKSHLSRQLLPHFFPQGENDPPELKGRVETWLLAVLKDVLPRYVSAVVLNTEMVHQWLTDPILKKGAPSPGEILTACSLLIARKADSKERYYLNTIDNLKQLTVESFVGNFLKTLLRANLMLLDFGNAEKKIERQIWIGPNPNDPQSFGLRLVAQDLSIASVTNLVIQLGAKDMVWIDKTKAAIGKLEPGFSVYLPIGSRDPAKPDKIAPHFSELQFNLINFGIDFKGREDKPLLDLRRFKLGAVKPRALMALKMDNWKPSVDFGAGITLAEMAVSLAPNTLTKGEDPDNDNPIAKNLLGSGTDETAENPPANPTFSVTAAYSKQLWVELSSDTTSGSQIIIPVQRSFGPLHANSLGLGWEQEPKRLDVLFDGSISLAGLKVDLINLTVGIPVTRLTDFSRYKLSLAGLDVSFKGGAVDISGGLLKTTDPYLSYTGAAIIKAASFSLVAVGSYAEVPVRQATPAEKNPPKAPSLFVFGALNSPLGGPPAFFIMGVAAGFSFNRNITLPDVGNVQNFPLVKGVVDGTFAGGDNPDDALTALSKVVAPEIGQYWLAAGIKFTSFKLVNAFALLFLKFGREWEIDLLGLANMALPPAVPKDLALAYIELGLKVAIKPVKGVVAVEAQLTPNSYIIAKPCKLTGGFAFYLWFLNVRGPDYEISAGDFVISLGGYHPAFQKPKYYPEVPRLGFTWPLDVSVGKISISGGAYFALTPTAVMAGGYLHVVFEVGPLRAWLDAAANFLIEWQPFYFKVDIKVSIGVAFHIKICGVSITLKAELGADLELEGPPTHGKAHVSWFVISFTIPIGSGKNATEDTNLDWAGFEENFLPKPHVNGAPGSAASSYPAAAMNSAGGDATAPVYQRQGQQVLKLHAETGLLKDNAAGWLIHPVPFTLRVESAVPISLLTVTDSGKPIAGSSVGVRPMGLSSDLKAPLTVAIRDASGKAVNLSDRSITISGNLNGAPAALWSKAPLDRKHAPDPKTMIIKDALTGLTIQCAHYVRSGRVQAFPLENLKYDRGDPINLPYSDTPTYAPSERISADEQKTAFKIIKETIMHPDVVQARNEIFRALRAGGITAPDSPDLTLMSSSADLIFQARPILARLGIYQTGSPEEGTPIPAPAARKASAEKPRPPVPPELQGATRRYQLGTERVAPAAAATLPHANRISGRWVDSGHKAGVQTLKAFSAPAAAAASSLISEGTLVLWKLDPATPHRLQTDADGKLAVRLTGFDQYGELLADINLNPGDTAKLPPGTAQAAIQDAVGSTAPIGWQVDSLLTKVNNCYALGDGFCLRSQNINRLEIDKGQAVRGIINAAELLASNQVQTAGGKRKQGWIETLLPTRRHILAVVVESSADPVQDALRLTAGHTAHARAGTTTGAALRPSASFKMGSAFVLVYRTPQPAADADYLNIVAQPLSGDTKILGVYALAGDRTDIGTYWETLSLKHAALDLAQDVPAATHVTLVQDIADLKETL